eukprot:1183853-Prorocentrum_minimum.AAC.2
MAHLGRGNLAALSESRFSQGGNTRDRCNTWAACNTQVVERAERLATQRAALAELTATYAQRVAQLEATRAALADRWAVDRRPLTVDR